MVDLLQNPKYVSSGFTPNGTISTKFGQGFESYTESHSRTVNGKVVAKDSFETRKFSWTLACPQPISITVSAKPHYIKQESGEKDSIGNNEKVFAITWK